MLEVIYEDNHLLALNKPPGLLTQPSGTERPSLEEEAKAWIKRRDQKKGGVFLEAVHRLDRPASGVVLFSKSQKALPRLHASIREKECQKIYFALLEGRPKEPMGYLKNFLLQGSHRTRVVSKAVKSAKEARLYYHLLKCEKETSLLEIHLITGRYHQIRAQMAWLGCPILGDEKYGAQASLPCGAICLHHHHLEIPHPIAKQRLIIEAPFPFSWPLTLS